MKRTPLLLGSEPRPKPETNRKPNGAYNDLIRHCIGRGMAYVGGKICYPSGRAELDKKPESSGYYTITLYHEDGWRAKINRGRVVCWLVNGPPPDDSAVCDHINRDRADDRPENLRWVSSSANIRKRMKDAWAEVKALRRSHDKLVEALRSMTQFAADYMAGRDMQMSSTAVEQARQALRDAGVEG